MKYNNKVRVLGDKPEYAERDVRKGEEGWLTQPEIRDGTFYVEFDIDDSYNNVKFCSIAVGDLEVVEEGSINDEKLLSYLCEQDPRWWCKVENGCIINLKGERKNKIPYKYDS